MAKVTEITVSVGQTIQLSQYEPRNYHLSYKIEIEEGEDKDKIIEHAKKELTKKVEDYFKGPDEPEGPFVTKEK